MYGPEHADTMLCRVFIFHLLAVGPSSNAVRAAVLTQATVLAAVDGEAHLSCRLKEAKEVDQVTWQKVQLHEDKNLASYNKYRGQTVNPGFTDRIRFKDAELLRNSIVLRNVTREDEGCYLCLFNAFPDFALKGETCLQVYELHEPVLQIRPSNSSEGPVVWCSATGRPAPTVNLTVAGPNLSLSHHSSARVHNANGTVTVSRTAVLPAVASAGGARVGCAARVLSGPQTQAFVLVPELRPTSADESGPSDRGIRWPIFPSAILCVCVCTAAIILRLKKIIQKREPHLDLGMNDNPENAREETLRDLEQAKTPQNPTPDQHDLE